MRSSAPVGALMLAIVCAPCAGRAQDGNPFEGDAAAIRAGGPLFAARCAACHSPDATGIQGPDLTQIWLAGGSDRQVFDAVRNGIEGSIMPPSTAPDDELWAIVAYLRSISTVPPFDPGGGDAEEGRRIFDADCALCHLVDGRGGSLGPELTRIALARSREALTRAIRDPGESVAAGFRAVTLVTRHGERIEGIAKGEDAFSIQLVDLDGRLQGYLKSELDAIERGDDSPMPRFGRARLGERDLDDLLAYLGTLRAAEPGGSER